MWKYIGLTFLFCLASCTPQNNYYGRQQQQRGGRERERQTEFMDYNNRDRGLNNYKDGEEKNITFVIGARGLPRSTKDPYAKVFISGKYGRNVERVVETEVADNDDRDPKWMRIFQIPYQRGVEQKLFIEVRDRSRPETEVVGDATVELDNYVELGHHITVPLKGARGADLIIQDTAPFKFFLELRDVPSSDDFGGKSDPYVICYFRYGREGRDRKFYETDYKTDVDRAKWREPINFEYFQRGSEQWFHFVVKDSDTLSADDVLGEGFLDVEAFADKKQPSVIKLGSKGSDFTLYVNPVEEVEERQRYRGGEDRYWP